MRYVVALLAIFFARSALAEENTSARLFGSWRLISFQLKVVGEEGEPREYLAQSDWADHLFSRASCRRFYINVGQTPPDQ
jgi:hypothetical protein